MAFNFTYPPEIKWLEAMSAYEGFYSMSVVE